MATKVNLRPLPADVWNLAEMKAWRAKEESLRRYLREAGFIIVSYPNGNTGWERRRGAGQSLRETLEEWGQAHGYALEWVPGDPHTCSVATLKRLED